MQNLILDNKNYLNLIDFSYAILYSKKNNPKNYIFGDRRERAPEIKNFSKYDYNSDYYRIGGSIIYYLIFKKYINEIKMENNITEVFLNYSNISNYSSSCIDFINKLIITDYKKRLGFKCINELKNHSFFKNFNSKDLEKKRIKSPLLFKEEKINKTYCNAIKFSNYNRMKFKKTMKNRYYIFLLNNFNYVNKLIIEKNFNRIN